MDTIILDNSEIETVIIRISEFPESSRKWTDITGKPAVIAAGSTIQEALEQIGLENVNAEILALQEGQITQNEAIELRATTQYVNDEIGNVVEYVSQGDQTNANAIIAETNRATTAEATKVDKVAGFGLSEENFTTALKNKLDSITAIFTTALKTAYDSAVTWISTNGTNILNHLSSTSNPHSVTKTQVGLGSVDDTPDTAKPVSTAQQTALNLKINSSLIGANNGVASLNSSGKVPLTQISLTTTDVPEGTNKYNATHTGEVTGSTALTITNKAVTLAKIQDISANSILGNDLAVAGVPKQLSVVGASIVANVFTITYQNAVTAYNAASGVDTALTNAMSPVQMFQNLQKQMDARILNTGLATNLVLGNGTYQSLATLPAFTATKLLTQRNINGVAFDGTANITVADSTKEPTANKSITLTSPDDIKFPTTKAVSDALALKADISSPTFTGTVGGITAAMVGAPSGSGTSTGTNTGDQTWTTLSGKPTFATVATTGAYADLTGTPSLAGYAPLASPTFTGTVSGITKSMVGLSNVDNTADSAKNVLTSTKLLTARNINGVAFNGTANITVADATKEPSANKAIVLTSPDDIKFPTTKAVSDALALKANLASPTFTGTPSLPTGTTAVTQTAGDNSTKLATTAYVKTAVDAVTSSVTVLKGSTTANNTDVTINRYKDITVTGAAIGDVVNIDDQFRLLAINFPFWISAKVTATNTVRIYFSNLQLSFNAGTTDASSALGVYTNKPIENPGALAWTINYTIIK